MFDMTSLPVLHRTPAVRGRATLCVRQLQTGDRLLETGPLTLRLAVIMERRVLHNKWADHAWEARALQPEGADRVNAPRLHATGDAATQWLFPPLELTLHTDEADNYLLNVMAPEPRIFVMWRPDEEVEPPLRVMQISASYGEAARWLDSGEKVDGLPMPALVRDWVESFARRYQRPPEPRRQKRFARSGDGNTHYGGGGGHE
jgi:hypothetical protein